MYFEVCHQCFCLFCVWETAYVVSFSFSSKRKQTKNHTIIFRREQPWSWEMEGETSLVTQVERSEIFGAPWMPFSSSASVIAAWCGRNTRIATTEAWPGSWETCGQTWQRTRKLCTLIWPNRSELKLVEECPQGPTVLITLSLRFRASDKFAIPEGHSTASMVTAVMDHTTRDLKFNDDLHLHTRMHM